MTPAQIKLARHALGLPNRGRRSYRNHFVTEPGSRDFDEWKKMVDDGNAKTRKGSALTGGDDLFWLTAAGAMAACKSNESLDPEDFR